MVLTVSVFNAGNRSNITDTAELEGTLRTFVARSAIGRKPDLFCPR